MNDLILPSSQHALQLDRSDPLAEFRSRFHYPSGSDGDPHIYFCGNSLGLQPKTAAYELDAILSDWARLGVDGHFKADPPWIGYHRNLSAMMARIVGALPVEVSLMNALTINLHLALASFYRPSQDRFKIIMEYDAFPSDRYAVESMLHLRGIDPKEALVFIPPNDDGLIDLNILKRIISESQPALVLLGNVNYYTGQALSIAEITECAHQHGALIGWDLAHAVGNIPLNLHQDQVDFAVWCTYKYLNAGPGSLAGIFIHEKHSHNTNTPRLGGWWSQKLESRFDMRLPFDPIPGAEGWIISNQSIMAMAPLKASLQIFDQIGMKKLYDKSSQLTTFLYESLQKINNKYFTILTPVGVDQRGCQLSLYFHRSADVVFQKLVEHHITVDFRKPNVIRVAPVPLYNTYTEVWQFIRILDQIFKELE